MKVSRYYGYSGLCQDSIAFTLNIQWDSHPKYDEESDHFYSKILHIMCYRKITNNRPLYYSSSPKNSTIMISCVTEDGVYLWFDLSEIPSRKLLTRQMFKDSFYLSLRCTKFSPIVENRSQFWMIWGDSQDFEFLKELVLVDAAWH